MKQKINKLKKQNNNMKKTGIMMIVMLICFSTIVSASLHKDLVSFEGRSCTLVDVKGTDSPAKDELMARFNLVNYCGSSCDYGACNIVLDYEPYGDEVSANFDFVSGFSTLAYNKDVDSIFVLAQDEYSLEKKILDLVAYYPDHSILTAVDDMVTFPESYFDEYAAGSVTPSEPVFPDGCSDNPLASIYGFNEAFYGNPVNGSMSSSCAMDSSANQSLLIFPYCEDDELELVFRYCECDDSATACVVKSYDVFHYINNFGTNKRLTNRLIDTQFIGSVVRSWVDN